jgi:putative drug exporter of the RND superfamily
VGAKGHVARRLAFWLAAIAILGALGMHVERDLTSRPGITVSGTEAARAEALEHKHFGTSSTLIVLLEGPRAERLRQAHLVADRFTRDRRIAVLGPWSPGASEALAPGKDRTMLLARIDAGDQTATQQIDPQLRRTLRESTSGPVHSYLTGFADIGSGLTRETMSALEKGEIVAAPLLVLVLLLVFRGPIAAAIPLGLGLTTIAASRGLIELISQMTSLDIVALSMASMMGLALGVDYSLVMVARFREELGNGASSEDAVRTVRRASGHTVIAAGFALALAMVAAALTAPGASLAAAAVGVLVAAVVSVTSAVIAVPSVLALLGENVNRWTLPTRDRGRWTGLLGRVGRRPLLAGGAVLVVVGAMCAPALAISMGSPDPRSLPASSIERRDFEHIYGRLGAAWSAPYQIIVASRKGPITAPDRLRVLAAWQRKLAATPGVVATSGPSEIAARTRKLDRVSRLLAQAKPQQKRLAHGLGRVDDGVRRLRDGLGQAAGAARQIQAGGSQGRAAMLKLDRGLGLAEAGSRRLARGLDEARSGAAALDRGARRAKAGAGQLHAGIGRLASGAQELPAGLAKLEQGVRDGAAKLDQLRRPARTAEQAAADARAALDRMLVTSKGDPRYAQVYKDVATIQAALSGRNPITGAKVADGYDGMDASLAAAVAASGQAAGAVAKLRAGATELLAGLRRLGTGAGALSGGLARLRSGTRRLRAGAGRLAGGSSQLADGVARLRAGAARIAAGTSKLTAGSAKLAQGLSAGTRDTGRLAGGVSRMHAGVSAAARKTGAATAGAGSANFARSGYTVLAAVDSSSPAQRTASSFALDVDRGGQATRIVVVQKGDPTVADQPVRRALDAQAADLARRTGFDVAVGGPAVTLQDFGKATADRLPLMVLVLMAVTYLALVAVLRSLLLPLLAVALNALTVFAALGILALGFQGSAPLGGPGQVDGLMALAVFGTVFGLSIDYEVFILSRMREGYDRFRDTSRAVDYGLRSTASVVTGAALAMTGVFFAFAASPVINMRQFGVGLTVAVLLDATVVRLVLLPALIRLLGPAAWWLPRGLERRIPAPRIAAAPSGD